MFAWYSSHCLSNVRVSVLPRSRAQLTKSVVVGMDSRSLNVPVMWVKLSYI